MKSVLILLIIGLVFPTVNYNYYVISVVGLIIFSKKIILKQSLGLYVAIYLVIISFFRYALSNYNEDLSEIFRMIYIALLTSLYFKNVDYRLFLNVFRVVVVLLFISMIFQWIFPYSDFWAKFKDILYSDNHYNAGLKKIAPRAMGFMSNIIEAGFLFFSSLIVALKRLLKKDNLIDKFFATTSITGIFLTQSKSLIILGSILFILFLILNWKSSKLIIITLLLISFNFGDEFLKNFDQLQRLSNTGLQTSSFLARVNLWEIIYNKNILTSNFVQFLFGFGRGEFANSIGDITFDSDFFYYLNQFGLIGFLLITISLIFTFVNNIKSKYYFLCLFFFLILIGGFLIDLTTNVKVIFIILITTNILKYENRSSLC